MSVGIEAIATILTPIMIIVEGMSPGPIDFTSTSLVEVSYPYFSFGNGPNFLVTPKNFPVGFYNVTAYPLDNDVSGRLEVHFSVANC